MNGIVVVKKEQDWTSHDVVAKLRGILRERRIGHGGTLDPMATGVLPVFVGRATRAVEFCENAEKEYIAGLRLGMVTDTQDVTGNVISTCDKIADKQAILSVLSEFRGKQLQIPPMYSAVKINGQKMYDLARNGVTVERKPREIEIKELELLDENGEYKLRVVCSKGTYVRTLCHDIGEKLGCGGVMSSLSRVRAGGYNISEALTLQEISAFTEKGETEKFLRPVDSLFKAFPQVTVDSERKRRCLNGNDFSVPDKKDGQYRVYDEDGGFLMLGKMENGMMKTVKSFFEVK